MKCMWKPGTPMDPGIEDGVQKPTIDPRMFA
jgi:hypothetical protein